MQCFGAVGNMVKRTSGLQELTPQMPNIGLSGAPMEQKPV